MERKSEARIPSRPAEGQALLARKGTSVKKIQLVEQSHQTTLHVLYGTMKGMRHELHQLNDNVQQAKLLVVALAR